MSAVTRHNIFETFRPWLDKLGYTAPRIAIVNTLCDRLGLAAANDNAPPAAAAELGPETPAIALITAELLKVACPENSIEELRLWVEPIKRACRRWGIDQFREVAAFLAQCGHESQGFTRLEEILNYRAERLCQVWPKRFPTLAFAQGYARNPEKLANFVYANRMGNGPPESGDGWRHRGSGILQNTGKRNQQAFAEAIGIELAEIPAYLRTRDGAAMGAGFFWFENNLDRLAATPGVEDETRAINGGQHGLLDRQTRFNRLIEAMLAAERRAA